MILLSKNRQVSGIHCSFYKKDDGWYVADLNSTTDYAATRGKGGLKKKNRLPLIFGFVGLFVFIILIASMGGGKKTTTTSKTNGIGSAGSVKTVSSNDSGSDVHKEGNLSLQVDTILVGDTVNTRYMAGGEIIFYADDLKLTSSDESAAVVKRSSDGQHYVVEGKKEGTAEITGTYGDYVASQNIRVISFNEVMDEHGLEHDLFDSMIASGNIAIEGHEIKLTTYGDAKISLDFFKFFKK